MREGEKEREIERKEILKEVDIERRKREREIQRN